MRWLEVRKNLSFRSECWNRNLTREDGVEVVVQTGAKMAKFELILANLWGCDKNCFYSDNAAGADRTVVDQRVTGDMPVSPWTAYPSDSVEHRGSDAMRLSFSAY